MYTYSWIPALAMALSLVACDSDESRKGLGVTISAGDFSTQIDENPEEGTLLGVITANTSDGSAVTFSIDADSESPEGALQIDAETGELTVADASLFEYDDVTEINALVSLTSGILVKQVNVNIILNETFDLTSDREALLALYDENTSNILDWDIGSDDLTNWTGVTLTDGRVTGLDVSSQQIEVLSADLYKLSLLTSLDVADNQITAVPDLIAEYSLTFLDLSNNSIDTTLSEVVCEQFAFDGVNFIKDDTAVCASDVVE